MPRAPVARGREIAAHKANTCAEEFPRSSELLIRNLVDRKVARKRPRPECADRAPRRASLAARRGLRRGRIRSIAPGINPGVIERTEAEPEKGAVEHHPVRAEDAGKRGVELLLDAKGGLLEDAAGLLE